MSSLGSLKRWMTNAIVALAFACAFLPATDVRAAADAADTVRSFYSELLQTMRDGPKLGAKGRYEKLEPVIRQTFDIPYMTRMTVGPAWANMSDEQKEKLTQAFGRYITAQYASNFDSFSGEILKVQGEQPSAFGRVVQSQIVPPDGDPVAMNYLLRQDGDKWRIGDVYLGGTISELSIRRSEFSSILRRDGVDGLVSMLERKADAIVASAQS